MAIFALIDCNNFYVSCERIFNLKLNKKAVVVLSNNDGCVVARSNEAKLLGIKMAQPYFQVQAQFKQHEIIALSSNYSLYADISQRVMTTIHALCPNIEYYSIDEVFVRLDDVPELINFVEKLQQTIQQNIGIPVSIGVASTKVLAKTANHIAKKHTVNGIYNLLDLKLRDYWLEKISVADLWGIGRRWAVKLNRLGIITARQLQQTSPTNLRPFFNILLLQIIEELRGVACMDLVKPVAKKSILCSRSFGLLITELKSLQEALSTYVSRACEKLRSQRSFARQISIFLRTNRHKKNEPQRYVSMAAKLPFATDNTLVINRLAQDLLKHLYKEGYRYQKVGVYLFDFCLTEEPLPLFENTKNQKDHKIMTVLDKINQRFGSDSLFLASAGIERAWRMRRNYQSPHYTTKWSDILVINEIVR